MRDARWISLERQFEIARRLEPLLSLFLCLRPCRRRHHAGGRMTAGIMSLFMVSSFGWLLTLEPIQELVESDESVVTPW
jgi:hypothetical protein